MTWNTITTVWLLLSALGTVIIVIGIAVWVLKHYNQDIAERESVQHIHTHQNDSDPDNASHNAPYHHNHPNHHDNNHDHHDNNIATDIDDTDSPR